MKTRRTKTFVTSAIVLGLMICGVEVVGAVPLGTAFTYQGRLVDSNQPADGLYDFEFVLYDDPDPNVVGQVAGPIHVESLDVIEGYFGVVLDFGSEVFDGNARWLEVCVRPGELEDPNVYTVLLPRQEIAPVPYALQTRGLFVDNVLNVGIGTASPDTPLHILQPATKGIRLERAGQKDISISNAGGGFLIEDDSDGEDLLLVGQNGNVGIGTTSPTAKLDVEGSIGFGLNLNSLLTEWGAGSDIDALLPGSVVGSIIRGPSSFHLAVGIYGNEILDSFSVLTDNNFDGSLDTVGLYVKSDGKVGIGTASPAYKLDVSGDVRATGTIYGTLANVPSETDPTVLASVKDGITWSEVSSRPAGLDDGDQVGIASETDPTVLASVKDGITWTEVSNRPTGLDDGDQVGITSETDPQVGSNTTNYIPKWNGSSLASGTIYDNGNVGIGKTNPSAKLDVNGDISAASAYKIAGNTVLSISGPNNMFVGVGAGASNISGRQNTFTGYYAGYSNTTGQQNTFSGYQAGYSNDGNYNTFSGYKAGYYNRTGYNNTFSGYGAGYYNTIGYHNTFSGHYAGERNKEGSRNTFSGSDAGRLNTEGNSNTFSGHAAGFYNTKGNGNTFSGSGAGFSNTEGHNNTFLGGGAGHSNQTGNNNVFIGNYAGFNETGSNKRYIGNSDANNLIYGNFSTGRVGIGTTSPGLKLHVNGDIDDFVRLTRDGQSQVWDLGVGHAMASGTFFIARSGTSRDFNIDKDGRVGIGTTSPGARLDVLGKIRISDSSGTPIVEMGEGLDYAEGFDVSDKTKIGPGSVVVIDADNPGKLRLSDTAYDKKVAGIVAGAKGLGSGVRLGSEGFDANVALAGRVYCNVDATQADVQPGDLLTTSATPGCAMKAADYKRAQGAILGKAMEKLEKGQKGQILVLVTLQ